MSGMMAVAYFLFQAPANFHPVLNGGKSATEIRFFHLATVFWLTPWRLARTLRLS